MLLCLYFCLAALGFAVLIAGWLQLSRHKAIEGPAARLWGLVAMVPLPLTITGGILYGFYKSIKGKPQIDQDELMVITIIQIGLLLFFCLALIALFFLLAIDPTKKKKRRPRFVEWDEDLDEDELPPRRKHNAVRKDDYQEDKESRSRRKHPEFNEFEDENDGSRLKERFPHENDDDAEGKRRT